MDKWNKLIFSTGSVAIVAVDWLFIDSAVKVMSRNAAMESWITPIILVLLCVGLAGIAGLGLRLETVKAE